MGNDSSKNAHLTQEQKDIRYLADRMSFGDRELQRIYRCYYSIRKQQQLAFLSDWTLTSARLAADETQKEVDEEWQDEQKYVLQLMEHKILPRGFGNALYRNCFVSSRDAAFLLAEHHSPKAESVPTTTTAGAEATPTTTTAAAVSNGGDDTDEYTRVSRLEKFFDAASNCSGRRGNRAALTELVTHVSKFHSLNDESNNHAEIISNSPSPSPIPPPSPSVSTPTTAAPTTTTTRPPPPPTPLNNNKENLVSVHHLVDSVYRMALASAFLSSAKKEDDDITQFFPNEDVSDHAALRALSQSIVEFAKKKRLRANPYGTPSSDNDETTTAMDGWVTKEDVLEWSEMTAPLFSVVLPTLMHLIMFPDASFSSSRTFFELPRIMEESCFFDHGSSPLLFSFGCLSSSLRGTFVRLYTSLSDGLSFNRLQNALLGYGGPTLLLIRETQGGGIFGAFTSSSWKESKDFYGTGDCFLFQLLPTTAIYRPSGSESNFMYCNSEARSRGYDGQAHGIGFGGSVNQPRLYLNEEFDACQASSQDLTFENGPLLPRSADGTLRKRFDIESVEVWGVGGEDVVNEALGARVKARAVRDAVIRQSRKVDRASFLDDFRNGLIDSKAFKYRQEIQGRAEVDVEERHNQRQRRLESL